MSDKGKLYESNIELSKQKDAILLTEDDVFNIRNKKIQDFNNPSAIWALKNGPIALGVCSLATSTSVNLLFKNFFQIRGLRGWFAFIPSTFAVSVLPSATDCLITSSYFIRGLLLSKKEQCMLCHEIKTIGIHTGIGFILPVFFGFLVNFGQAETYGLYPTPKANNLFKTKKDRQIFFKETRKIFFKSLKSISTPIFCFFAFNLISTSFLFYKQQEEFKNFILPSEITKNEIIKIKYKNKI